MAKISIVDAVLIYMTISDFSDRLSTIRLLLEETNAPTEVIDGIKDVAIALIDFVELTGKHLEEE